jgi:hypothetical protein
MRLSSQLCSRTCCEGWPRDLRMHVFVGGVSSGVHSGHDGFAGLEGPAVVCALGSGAEM